MKFIGQLFILAASVGLIACGPNGPTADSSEQSSAPDLPPDLPCGGVDLETDNQNCGECGNACTLWYEGTDWEAGACVDGSCGPQWSSCVGYETGQTCDEICGTAGKVCVSGGCAEVGAILIDLPWFSGDCQPTTFEPVETVLECDTPLVAFEDEEVQRNVSCCCDEPG